MFSANYIHYKVVAMVLLGWCKVVAIVFQVVFRAWQGGRICIPSGWYGVVRVLQGGCYGNLNDC